MTAAGVEADVLRHHLVERQHHLTGISGAFLYRVFMTVFPRIAQTLAHLAGAIAGLLEVPLDERSFERLGARARIGLHIDVGRTRTMQHHVLLRIDVDEFGVVVEVAMLGGVTVQSRTDGDHAIGLFAQLHRRLGGISTRDADMKIVLGQPGFRHQRGDDQRTAALRQFLHRVARTRPHRTATDQNDRMPGFAQLIGGTLEHIRVWPQLQRRHHAVGGDVGIIVIELLLLDVHRRAQHHRLRIESCQIKRLAHHLVGGFRRGQAHELCFAGGGKRRLFHALIVFIVIGRMLADEGDHRRRRARCGDQRGGQL